MRAFDSLVGFPVLTLCPSDKAISSIGQPALVLGEKGLMLGTPLTHQQRLQVAGTARQVFQAVTLGILRSRGLDHRLVEPESQTSAILVQEGKTAIERYSTFREFGVRFGQTPILCSLLGLDGMGRPPGSNRTPQLYGTGTIEHWTTALQQTRELEQLQRAIAQTRWRWSLRRPLGTARALVMGVPPERAPSGVRLLVSASDLENALEFLEWIKQQPGHLDAEGARRMSFFSINANLIAEAVGRPQPFGNALLR